jgi:chromosome segregation ATPase
MDLSINRLKVLGDEELQRLDLKITEYRNSNQHSILDKSINEIKTQISDLSSICKDIQTELNSKTATFNQLQNSLKEHQQKYELLNEQILNYEQSIINNEKLKTEFELKFETMNETISRLKIEEQTSKEKVSQLSIKLEQRNIQFKSEKEQIDNQIKLFELKIKELMQSSLTSHNNFIANIKSIELKQEVNDVQAIFDNIKFDLLTNLSRNIMNYSKDNNLKCYVVKYIQEENRGMTITKIFYKKIVELNVSRNDPHSNIFLHSDILKCKGPFYNFKCNLCKYTNKITNIECQQTQTSEFNICSNSKAVNVPKNYQEQKNKKEEFVKVWNEKYFNWFENNYDKILENIIIHPELLILIKKLNYQDFYNLFTSYEPFNINYIDSYQFISLVAFIATNGYNEKYMKLIELE